LPAKPSWLLHIPEIRSLLADVSLPVVDRAVIQQVFGLGRRQAIELMRRFGGYQAGRTFLIARNDLIGKLDAMVGGEEYEREAARREKLTTAIENVRRTRQTEAVRIPVSSAVFSCRMENLDPDVHLRAGKLEIDFNDPVDLLGKLFALTQAVANDYSGFELAALSNVEKDRIPA
jgi:hypothetical protein